jgi:hypothetical protein
MSNKKSPARVSFPFADIRIGVHSLTRCSRSLVGGGGIGLIRLRVEAFGKKDMTLQMKRIASSEAS